MEWSDALVIAATVAIINRLKSEIALKPYLWTVIAFCLGGALYIAGLYLPEVAKIAILIGLTASGLYDAYKKQ